MVSRNSSVPQSALTVVSRVLDTYSGSQDLIVVAAIREGPLRLRGWARKERFGPTQAGIRGPRHTQADSPLSPGSLRLLWPTEGREEKGDQNSEQQREQTRSEEGCCLKQQPPSHPPQPAVVCLPRGRAPQQASVSGSGPSRHTGTAGSL